MTVTLTMVRLGAPHWTDPERQQSIDLNFCVKMERRGRFASIFRPMTCWPAKTPARDCLMEVMRQLEQLLETRNLDFWIGETTLPGCIWEPSMHGRSVDDAQPTIILSSTSNVFRRNARAIIEDHDFRVDPRGIGIYYYSRGPDFFAGESSATNSPEKSSVGFEDRDGKDTNIAPNHFQLFKISKLIGASILIESIKFTMGGLVVIDGKLFGLTVAHAFENGNASSREVARPSPNPTIQQPGIGQVGALHQKRLSSNGPSYSQPDLDWAVCTLDTHTVNRLSSIWMKYPKRLIQEILSDTPIFVRTGTTGIVEGVILRDYSLVALPGSMRFQRMWVIILEREIAKGDCGSWVLDAVKGDLYGHIVAGKTGTKIAYLVLAQDIFEDIRKQFEADQVTLPTEADFRALSTHFSESQSPLVGASTHHAKLLPNFNSDLAQLPEMSKDQLLQTSAMHISTPNQIGFSRNKQVAPHQQEYTRKSGEGNYEAADLDPSDELIGSRVSRNEEENEDGAELKNAARLGDNAKIQQLLENGTKQGAGAALHVAAQRGNLETVKLLLTAKVCGTVAMGDALYEASGMGNAAIVRVLLKDTNWDDVTLDAALRAALKEATRWEKEEVMSLLQGLLDLHFPYMSNIDTARLLTQPPIHQ
ncbi:hypothetical protein N431DRAFT_443404 [Stipitochalara longipes BDJ]|nr:hypothetical protein N431DRAFT_443404 [Stipitochalara longipes BDJ]